MSSQVTGSAFSLSLPRPARTSGSLHSCNRNRILPSRSTSSKREAWLRPGTQTYHRTSRQRNQDTLRPAGKCIVVRSTTITSMPKLRSSTSQCAFVSLMSSRKVPFVLVSSSSTRGVTASRSLTTVQCRPLTSWRQILKVLFLQNPTCCDYCRAGRHQQVSTAQQLGSVPFRPGTPESGTSTSRSLPSCGSVNTVG